jgi:hypothetical protein
MRLESVTPRIRSTTLTIFPRDISKVKLKMAEAQLFLKKAGVKDISKAGTLSISRNIIVRPGVMRPRDSHIHGSPRSNELRLYGTLANRIVFSPPLPGDEILQDEAVLIGTKVDLGNSKLIISENVTNLRIITEELVAGPMAKITPQLVIRPKPKSYNYPQRQHASGFRNYNPTVETPASKFRSPSGSHGGKGADGANGYDGNVGNDGNDEKPAPSVEIITLAFNGVPEINLRGAPSGPGEDGQMGENGGHGAKGLHATCDGWGFCRRGAGHGGDGGNAGDGGKGGDGGLGGPGGNISIMSTYDGMRMFGEAPKIFIISGGLGGPGGKGGAPGNRGLGGNYGKPATCTIRNCDPEPSRRGDNGESGSEDRKDGQSYNVLVPGDDELNDKIYGPPGEVTEVEITEDDFQGYLTEPYLIRIVPDKGAPGTGVKVDGANLIEGDVAVFDNKIMPDSRFLTEDQIVFTIPGTATGGFHEIKIKRGTTYTNSYLFEVTPVIESISSTTGSPGDEVIISGRAFMPGANVVFGDMVIVPTERSQTEITFEVPPPIGDSPWIQEEGGKRKVAVYNPHPSDETSNEVEFNLSAVYGLRFDPAVDGWSFSETKGKGVPSWDTLCQTFGETEVWLSSLFRPITFWPFYFFYAGVPGIYEGFGTGPYGLCTGMATTSLNRFRSGQHNTHSFSISQVIREITIAFGHMIGIDQLKRFNNQVENGLNSVRQTFETIEDFFKNGTDLREAPILMFLPSGTIWDMDRLENAHTVLPYKITYEEDVGKFPARIYIYNHWHPGSHDDYVRFFEMDGKLHFEYRTSYPSGTLKYDTDHGYTLGASSLNFMLLSDADMPISLIEDGLLLLDTVFSPVNVRIENEEGKRIGYKDGKIHLELPDALFIPFAPNCYVLPLGDKYTRTIEGTEDGTYSYGIISSEGLNVYLKDVPTKAGSIDLLSMAADTESFTFESNGESKSFSMVIAQKVNQETRIAEIEGLQLEKGEKFLFWMDDNLNEFGMSNVEKPRSLNVQFLCQRNREDTDGITFKTPGIHLKQGEYLKFAVEDWRGISQANLRQTIFSEKALIPQKVREEIWDIR